MYINQEGFIDPAHNVYVYYDWWEDWNEAELTIIQFTNEKWEPSPRDGTEYLCYVPLDQIKAFANNLPNSARWEQVQFLWEIFQANQSE